MYDLLHSFPTAETSVTCNHLQRSPFARRAVSRKTGVLDVLREQQGPSTRYPSGSPTRWLRRNSSRGNFGRVPE